VWESAVDNFVASASNSKDKIQKSYVFDLTFSERSAKFIRVTETESTSGRTFGTVTEIKIDVLQETDSSGDSITANI